MLIATLKKLIKKEDIKMISTFDVETSFQITEEGKLDPSPKNPDNFLVSLGINDEYVFFKHRDFKGIPDRKVIQDILDKTTLLVGHNIKFDLLWLWEAGFNYSWFGTFFFNWKKLCWEKTRYKIRKFIFY